MSVDLTSSTVAECILLAVKPGDEGLGKPTMVTINKPHSDYKIDLVFEGDLSDLESQVGKPISGKIKGRVRRVDRMKAGGRFIEPVFGRPRRIQGRIDVVDTRDNSLVINFGLPVNCQLVMGQYAGDFQVGGMAACDLERGATFEIA